MPQLGILPYESYNATLEEQACSDIYCNKPESQTNSPRESRIKGILQDEPEESGHYKETQNKLPRESPQDVLRESGIMKST